MAPARTGHAHVKIPNKPKYKRQVRKGELPLFAYVEERARRVAREIGQIITASPLDEGGVIFVHGPMCSGKSIIACVAGEHVDGKRRCTIAQARLSRPDYLDGFVYSRRGMRRPAFSFSTPRETEELFDEYDVVIADAVQFVPYTIQGMFLNEVDQFVRRGGWFVGLALLHTSQQTEFLLPSLLRKRALIEYALTATCQKCGRRGATRDQRLVDGRPSSASDPELLPPSESVSYEARCDECLVVYS